MLNSGILGKRTRDGTGRLSVGEHFNQQTYLIPTVTSFSVTDTSYVPLDDTSIDTAGGQTIVLNGYGFLPGATVIVGTTTISVVTYLDPNRLTFIAPALSSGSYTVYVNNGLGNIGILVPGLVYSGFPTFTTPAGSLGSYYETIAINNQINATSDSSITYSLLSGTLPTGSTLAANGLISGTAPIDNSSTTYSFTINAKDAENQDTTRSFSLTINTDVVTWSAPANNTTYSLVANNIMSNVALSATSAAGYGITYTANALPSNVFISGSTIYGTPNTVQTVYSTITATSATTNRSAVRYLNWSIVLGDVFFNQVGMLLNTDRIPAVFDVDASNNYVGLVQVGTPRLSSINPYTEGYYSNFFDGTGDYLDVANNSSIQIGSSDFTFEGWFYPTAAANNELFAFDNVISAGYSAIRCRMNSSKQIELYMSTNGTSWASSGTSTGTLTLNSWNHVAVVRNGSGTNNIVVYINGSTAGLTFTFSGSGYTTAGLKYSIGAVWSSSAATEFWQGYISNFRVVKGTALYTSGFTPSTSPLTVIANTSLLTCQSNRLIDNSPNNFTLTKNGDTTISHGNPFSANPTTITVPSANNYSMYFDGTGDYLSIASSSAFTFAGDFTIEAWVYPTVINTNNNIISRWLTSLGFIFKIVSSGRPYFAWWIGSQGTVIGTSTAVVVNQWQHIAVTRSGTTVRLFVNGVADITTGTASGAFNNSTSAITIGALTTAADEPFTGYISNIRVLNGTALYTNGFTPSTAPLTAIANTQLLTCQSSTIIDNSNNAFTITAAGDARPTRNSPFISTQNLTISGNEGSTYFATTGDYVEGMQNAVANSAGQIFGTGDFTVECWIWPTNAGTTTGHNISRPSTLTNTWYLIHYNNGITWGFNGGNVSQVTGIMGINAWYHVAVSRVSGVTKGFVNGAQVFSVADVNNYSATPPYRPFGPGAGGAAIFYISNFRIIKGTGLYKSAFYPSFTPPAASDSSNTALLMYQTKQSSTNNLVVDNGPFRNLITRNGNATLTTQNPYGSNWSNYFATTSDYITTSSSAGFNFGTGDFTIELWYLPTTPSANLNNSVATLFDFRNGSISVVPPLFYYATGLGFKWYVSGADRMTIPDSAYVVGQWTHIAVSRFSGNTKIFINGTQQGATYADTNNYPTTALRIGSPNDGVQMGTRGPGGYISNFRVVKGTALYTANTTITTSPLTPIANTSLLACNTNRFVDTGFNSLPFTVTGGPTVQKLSPFSNVTITPNSYSASFDGVSYVIVPGPSSANTTPIFGLGTSNFTIECWVYITNTEQNWIWDFRTSGGSSSQTRPELQTNGSTLTYTIGSSPGGDKISVANAVSLNKWYHIAVVRISGSTKMYVNGTQVGTAYAGNDDFGEINTLTIGSVGDSPGYATTEFNGNISNLRIVRGLGVYTGNFTVPTTALTVTQNASSNVAAIPEIPVYGGSVFFDGTGDYLTVPSNAAFAFGTGDFTVEFWAYPTVNNRQDWVDVNNGTGPRLLVYYNGTNIVYNASNSDRITGPAMTLNAWQHIAVSRVSGSTKMFINGTQVGITYTDTTNFSSNQPVYIGKDGGGSTVVTGYMSNIRILKGTGLYTANTSAPTIPLTAIANTQLLIAQSSSIVDRSSNLLTITAAGNAVGVNSFSPFANGTSYLTLSTDRIFQDSSINKANTYVMTGNLIPSFASPFNPTTSSIQSWSPSAYGSSVLFDGTGDYLSIPDSTIFTIGANDFTFECWVYPKVITAGNNNLLIQWGTLGNAFIFKYIAAGRVRFEGAATGVSGTSTAVVANSWNHVAITRSSSTVRLFVNGIMDTTTATIGALTDSANNVTIGAYSDGTIEYVTGYISDIKLTVGNAGYTSTFFPPLAPTTITSNTVVAINNTPAVPDYAMINTYETVGNAKQVTLQSPYYDNYSVYFDGTGDYLSLSGATALNLGTSVCCFELWVNPITVANASNQQLFQSGSGNLALLLLNGGAIQPGQYLTSGFAQTTATISAGVWSHIVVTRDASSNWRVFINGVLQGYQNYSFSPNNSSLQIGGGNASNGYLNGYISNFRVTVGSIPAAYVTASSTTGTSIFTPPTSPLTAITDTKFLACQSNRLIDKSSNAYVITRNGDAAVQPLQPFTGSNTTRYSSMFFDGNGDYLKNVDSKALAFGTGPYTVEFWMYYQGATTGEYDIIEANPATGGFQIYMAATSGGLKWGIYTSTSFSILAAASVPINQWTHIIVSRVSTASNQTFAYVNGLLVTTATDANNYTGVGLGIGGRNSGANYFTGYLSDIRITNTSRYSANSTPTTIPLNNF